LDRVKDVLEEMIKRRSPITVAAVARASDVSRTFLYEHPAARMMVREAMSRAAGRRAQSRQADQEELEASWRERALNAEAALKAANTEILAQREQIAELLGQIRDLRSEWTQEDIARIVTDNGALRRQVRDLSTENKSLASKLSAARQNLRFTDKRLAELEAQVVEQSEVI